MTARAIHNQTTSDITCSFRASDHRLFRKFVDQIESELALARFQSVKKRQALNAYHQEMIDGMSLQERLKAGMYRF